MADKTAISTTNIIKTEKINIKKMDMSISHKSNSYKLKRLALIEAFLATNETCE